jgi:hypothetical protein
MVYLFGRPLLFFGVFFLRGEGVLVNMRLAKGHFFPCPFIFCFCSEPMFLLFRQKKKTRADLHVMYLFYITGQLRTSL